MSEMDEGGEETVKGFGFRRLPVRTPTRIWWSWFVKIIPSDAMFSSAAVARTENSRQGPEPSASNLEGRGRGGRRGGGGGWRRRDTGKEWGLEKKNQTK